MKISKIFIFHYAHFLALHKGACKNIHGHTGKAILTFEGEPDPQTGMIMDFSEIVDMWKSKIAPILDHQFLIPFKLDIGGIIFDKEPTCENIAIFIKEKIENYMEGYENIRLCKITVYETETSFVELEI